jgi:DNA modification methylase
MVVEMPTEAEPVKVVEGDCLEVLRSLPDGCVDAVITDPPYGTDVPRDGYGRRQLWNAERRIEGDSDLAAMDAGLRESLRLLAPNTWAVCFVSPKRHAESVAVAEGAGFAVKGEVVWDKAVPGLGGGIRYQHELVVLLAKGEPAGMAQLFSVIRCNRVQHARHPHEKPVGLVRELVRYTTTEGWLILDPFAGSGTTGVAAISEGRRAILVEKDPEYAALCRRRVSEAMGTGAGSLLAGLPAASLFPEAA